MSASYAKTITEAVIVIFAGISGDNNPLHLNEEFAKEVHFSRTYSTWYANNSLYINCAWYQASWPWVHLYESSKVSGSVRPGETVTTTVTISDVFVEKKRVIAQSVCKVRDKIVVEGKSVLLVPSRESN